MSEGTPSAVEIMQPETPGVHRLIVVDDEAEFLDDMVSFFRHRGFDTRGVCDGASLDLALNEKLADLVVLDINLPDEDGVSITRRLRKSMDIGIVMLTCRSQPCNQAEGLRAGADAYLAKETDLFVVEETVRAVLRRVVFHDAEDLILAEHQPSKTATALSEASWVLDSQTWLLSAPNGSSTNLTAKEFTLFSCLLEDPGMPCERSVLLACQGKHDTDSARRSLDSTMSRLKRKLEIALEQPCPIQAAYGVGYVFLAAAETTPATEF